MKWLARWLDYTLHWWFCPCDGQDKRFGDWVSFAIVTQPFGSIKTVGDISSHEVTGGVLSLWDARSRKVSSFAAGGVAQYRNSI